jgi:hypothetical protein
MPLLTLEINSRIVGARPEAPALDRVLLELLEQRITVTELIRHTIEEQVRNLTVRRKLAAEDARRALDRQFLSPGEINAQAEHGAVRWPSQRSLTPPALDPQFETEKAIRAFQAGSYVILVNGRRVENLDEVLTFDLDAKITFLRLTPLVGG